MSSCGGNCGCGSGCKCGNGCGCNMFPDLSSGETYSTTSETVVLGVAPVMKGSFGESDLGTGFENDCKCGSNCSCTSCSCGK